MFVYETMLKFLRFCVKSINSPGVKKEKRKKMTEEVQKVLRKANKIDELSGEIRELIDQGFYPAEYHKFSRKVENKLSEIETLSSEIYREFRNLAVNKEEK